MDKNRSEVKEIFCAAIEKKTPEERNAYLDEVCGDDKELRAEVDALLNAHYGADESFLKSPPGVDGTLGAGPLSEGPGTRIGRYKLLQLIGEGGFGVVYMAEQEEPILRRVALKIIKLGMDTKQVIARFEAERQALAMMDHPNIAKVLDAGATDTGRPYFVMELVKGIPITEYCDKNNLDTQQRLELFIDVCKAVQHAHQKGIIHRDIKPSNVMITLRDGKPVPKIIDFGIAKAMQQRLTEKTLFTEFKQFIGTPEYMSPEQAELSELDVDTRSDIYSLGVLLYELLTGTTPFDAEELRSAAYDEMLKTIRETDPPRPSMRLSTLGDAVTDIAKHRNVQPAELCRIIRGDLDWVVMKTLEKDRTRRYETANELAQDIQRHLGNEPVVASPPSKVYRVRKFVRRNRALVTSVAVVFVVLMGGIVASTIFAVGQARARAEAKSQQQRAEANFQKANEAVGAMTLVAKRLFINRPRIEQVQRELLQKAQVFYEGFLEENRSNPAVRLETGLAYKHLGDIFESLGQSEQAVSAYEKSIVVFEELAADLEDEAEYKRQIAISNNYMGVALCSLGRFEEALAVYERAAGLLEELMAEFGDEPDYMLPLSWVYRHRGLVLQEIGEVEEAEKIFRRTLEVRQKLVTNQPDESEYQRELALILTSLGHLLTNTGRHQQAEQFYRRAIRIRQELVAQFGNEAIHKSELGLNYHHLGDLLWSTGRIAEAADAYRKSVQVSKELTEEFPVEPAYGRQQAWSWHNLCQVLRILGELEEAEKACDEAIQLFERLAADYPEVADYQEGLASARAALTKLDEAAQSTEEGR